MSSAIKSMAAAARARLEALSRRYREWLDDHPAARYAYGIFSWICVIAFVYSLLFMEDARTMLLQYAWSFYVLLQFWVLARSKSLAWKTYGRFFLAGTWLIAPLNHLLVGGLTSLLGGQTTDTWSQALLTPVAEELLKLLPLGVYLLLSRRGSALGLADYALIGASTGAGFQFMEETARRLVSGRIPGYGVTLFDGKVIHWNVFEWFPGYFESSVFPDKTSSGHALLTALIALGIGFAVRLRKRLTGLVFLFPAFLAAWAILDHAVWNGDYDLPERIRRLHEWMGSGYTAKPLFFFLLAAALLVDYWAMNRLRESLPRLGTETVINPMSELLSLAHALAVERHKLGYYLAFFRERRELAFTELYGGPEARERLQALKAFVEKYYVCIVAAIAVLLLAGPLASATGGLCAPDSSSCFACLFDRLQRWWESLSGTEQALIVAGAFALSFPFLGFWSAAGLAMTGMGIASSGRQIADFIRDPRRLASPEYAAAAVFTLAFSRIPFGKVAAFRVLRTAKGFTRYEITTKGGLTYRTTLGSQGQIRSVFAHLKPGHLGTGTDTNDASRRFARMLGHATDDAGHAIGSRLGGLGSKKSGNIFPQNLTVNRGAFNQFEKMIADEVAAGKDVFIRVVPKYAAGSTRPYEVLYNVRIDGQTIVRLFPNP